MLSIPACCHIAQAPEVLRCEAATSPACQMATDAYAFGCIMWEVSFMLGLHLQRAAHPGGRGAAGAQWAAHTHATLL